MRRTVGSLAVVFALTALVAGSACPDVARPGLAASGKVGEVAIFYYPWYGTLARDGAWQHWQQHGNTPPSQIASSWFPVRGAYSSSDPAVVRSQMQEIASMGVDTVIVSWWGPGSVEAARLPTVARAAHAAGLKVAIHIEPYPGRTPTLLDPLIRELAATGVRDFYVYDSTTTPDDEWRTLNRGLSGVRLFANTALVGKADAGGFVGLYTYDTLVYSGASFHRVCASARKSGLLCAPSVGPGFNARRATGNPRIRGRAYGATYDRSWAAAVRAAADIVTITSYNEWHEGTQIEPAAAVGPAYLSYEEAYGLVGRSAQRAYLDRTALWIRRYRQQVGH